MFCGVNLDNIKNPTPLMKEMFDPFNWGPLNSRIAHFTKDQINARDGDGNTALMHVVRMVDNQRDTLIRDLIDLGADVNLVNDEGETALHMAVTAATHPHSKYDICWRCLCFNKAKERDTVELLLEKGARMERTAEKIFTPLGICLASGDLDCTQLLLSHGAKPTIDSRGVSEIGYFIQERPDSYHKIMACLKDAWKNDDMLWREEAETNNIKLISHVFNIKGASRLTLRDRYHIRRNIALEGSSPRWFAVEFSKFLQTCRNDLEDVLPITRNRSLRQTLNYFSDPHEDDFSLNRTRETKPKFIESGFSEHSAKILKWGQFLFICNLGEGARRPLEANCYRGSWCYRESESVTAARDGSLEDYTKLITHTLPHALQYVTLNQYDLISDVKGIRNEIEETTEKIKKIKKYITKLTKYIGVSRSSSNFGETFNYRDKAFRICSSFGYKFKDLKSQIDFLEKAIKGLHVRNRLNKEVSSTNELQTLELALKMMREDFESLFKEIDAIYANVEAAEKMKDDPLDVLEDIDFIISCLQDTVAFLDECREYMPRLDKSLHFDPEDVSDDEIKLQYQQKVAECIENHCILSMQRVGNCTWASLYAAIYALMQLDAVSEGRPDELSPRKKSLNAVEVTIERENEVFLTLMRRFKIHLLGKYFENRNENGFNIDHSLITAAFRELWSDPKLDDKEKKMMMPIEKIYLRELKEDEGDSLKAKKTVSTLYAHIMQFFSSYYKL